MSEPPFEEASLVRQMEKLTDALMRQMDLLEGHQELHAAQQAMLARQQEMLSVQQTMLGRQQELFANEREAERQFSRKQFERQEHRIEELEKAASLGGAALTHDANGDSYEELDELLDQTPLEKRRRSRQRKDGT